MRTPSLRSTVLRVDRPPGCVTMKWLMWKCSIGQKYVDFRAKWFLRERRLTKLPHRCSCPYVAAHFHEQLWSKCCRTRPKTGYCDIEHSQTDQRFVLVS